MILLQNLREHNLLPSFNCQFFRNLTTRLHWPQPEPQQEIVPPPDPDPPDLQQPQNEEPTFPIIPVPDPVVDPLAPGPQPFAETEALQKMKESQPDPKDNVNLPNHINQDLRDNHIMTVPTYPSLYATPLALWSK